MKEIPLTQGYVALVDDEDYERVSALTWHANKQQDGTVYATHSFSMSDRPPSKIQMHRLILGVTDPKVKVDHRNHNGVDNQRHNIRACTHQQNLANRKGQNKNARASRYRGVTWHKPSAKWVVHIGPNRKHVGQFDSEIAAAKAFDAASIALYGEFANPNFSQETSKENE